MSAAPRAAVVGPRLVYPDGRSQPSRRRFPTLAALLVESTPLEWRLRVGRLLARYSYMAEAERGAEPVEWVDGACLLARTTALEQVGGFDPLFFMYFEEVDLCRRLAAHGWETWYEPAATVVHHRSRSADLDVAAKDRRYYTSKYRYVARYWGAAAARALRLAAAVFFAGELAAQTLRRDARLAARYRALVRWHVHPVPCASES
jgi:GT2 family glycosyltransferase